MRWPFGATRPTQAVSEADARPDTRFAFKLFRELAASAATQNIVLSPASVMLCLGMLQEGATGETKAATARVLGTTDLGPEAAYLIKSALQVRGPSLELSAANSIWCDKQFSPHKEYVAALLEHFEAELGVLDFSNSESVATVNAWVAKRTQGKIDHLVDLLDPEAPLIAVNAVYFRDRWSQGFEREFTREESFDTGDGRQVRVPLMRGSGKYSYYEDSTFQAVRLGYKTSRLGMYVLLPAKRSSLQKLVLSLTPLVWERLTKELNWREGDLDLPRFRLAHQAELRGALQQLGMEIAFDRERAEFDGIHTPPPSIWIEQVFHQAVVEVNEEGTEAAAVTAVMVPLSSPNHRTERRFKMIVDRPFFFAIHDDYTNTILFMGSINDPS